MVIVSVVKVLPSIYNVAKEETRPPQYRILWFL